MSDRSCMINRIFVFIAVVCAALSATFHALAQTAPPQTLDQAVDFDASIPLGRVEAWIVGFQRLLPNIVVGLIVIAIAYVVGWAISRTFRSWAVRHNRQNLGDVLGSFLKWIAILFGVLLGLTIVVPSLKPGDLLAGLGVGSVAIGFAFQDILQNWLAGLLLLIRQPFQVGDQIIVDSYEGTVDRIESRATIITTYDKRRVIVPNAQVYTNAVTVNTAHPVNRHQYDLGIGYGDDIQVAMDTILGAIAKLPGIESDPKSEVLVWDLAASTVNLRIRWWCSSARADVVKVRSEVLFAVKLALDEAGIDMPYDTQVLLLHDQTDENDGHRGRQREGWPAPGNGEPPRPARLVRQEMES